MKPLNTWQRLPPKAIWYGLLGSLAFATLLVAVGAIFQAGRTPETAAAEANAAAAAAPANAPAAGAAPANAPASAAAPATADVASQSVVRHRVPASPPAQAVQVPPDYAVACAIHDSGSIDGVIPCAKFGEAKRCVRETEFASKPMPPPAMLTVVNRSNEAVRFYWLDRTGARALYASLPPGGHVTQQSHVGAHWLVATEDDRCLAIFDAATMTIGIY
jgi:hypothetical protein